MSSPQLLSGLISNKSNNNNITDTTSDRSYSRESRSSSSSSSLDDSIGSATISGPFSVGNSKEETCSYHALVEGESCRKPRSCYECLNADVAGVRDGCSLAPSGFCEYMSSYEASLDYRRNTTSEDLSSMGWYNFFPSSNTTYCEPTDKACELCSDLVNNGSLKQSSHEQNVSKEVTRRFCTGLNDCVCVMACEANDWEANMPTKCDANGSVPEERNASSSDTNHSTMLIVYIVLQVALIAVCMYTRGRWQRMAPRSRAEGPYNNIDAIASPSNRLRLSGWRKMQNTLIEREKNHLTDQHMQCSVSPREDSATGETHGSSTAA